MFTPQFVVFAPPGDNHPGWIINKLTASGFPPLVDAVHDQSWGNWFIEQFGSIDHRVYYNLPGFMSGFIQDVDLGIMGVPHIILYFTTTTKQIDLKTWGIIDKWINKILNDVDLIDESENTILENIIRLPTTSEAISKPEVHDVDDLVKQTDARNHYYSFECKNIPDFDKTIISICKPEIPRPFTIIISDFKEKGYKPLFTDLFASRDWGSIMDVNFLARLWKELGINEDFDLENRLKERTSQFLPNEECDVLCEPQVYRMHIEDILKGSSFGRIFY
jgi:hypothetical protein